MLKADLSFPTVDKQHQLGFVNLDLGYVGTQRGAEKNALSLRYYLQGQDRLSMVVVGRLPAARAVGSSPHQGADAFGPITALRT